MEYDEVIIKDIKMRIFFFFTLLFFVSCASKKTMDLENIIVTLSGFDVTTPPGWHVVSGSRSGVILNKFTKKEISEVGWALTGDAPKSLRGIKALDWIKTQKLADGNRNRMSTITNSFTPINLNGLDCMRYIQSSRDKKANKILYALGLMCLHPRFQNHYVDLSLSELYTPGDVPLNHVPDAEIFYKSLKSTDKIYSP